MYISCITFYQFSGEGHRGRAGWKVSPILIKGTPFFSPTVPSFSFDDGMKNAPR